MPLWMVRRPSPEDSPRPAEPKRSRERATKLSPKGESTKPVLSDLARRACPSYIERQLSQPLICSLTTAISRAGSSRSI